ncbi:MAG: hypothetical protein F4W95_10385 [Chloroflexi bacterium]|nr:hypothetical protein [Chloroflexota bacterium]MYD48880.1 hypothetical protein [Chloroflexota bacterium]
MPLGADDAFAIKILSLFVGVCLSPSVLTGIICARVMGHVGWRFAAPISVFMGLAAIVATAAVWGIMLNREHNTWANTLLNMGLVFVGCATVVWVACFLRNSVLMERQARAQAAAESSE